MALERGKGPMSIGTFTNDAAGHRKLIGVLTRRGSRARVCVESTGIYHLELALALVERVELMVANPRAAKDFARARLQRTKTDHTDAASIHSG